MQVLGVCRQALGSAEIHSVHEDDCKGSAGDHDQRTRQQWETNPWIGRAAIPKQPGCPGERLVYRMELITKERTAEGGLILKPIGDELRGTYIDNYKQ